MSSRTLLDPARGDATSLPAATQFSDNGIVSRTVLSAGRTRVVLFGFAAGQELTEHASPARALVQMLSGRAEWTLAGEKRTLGPGDLLHMPPGLPHAVRALEAFSMLLTLVRENNAAVTPAAAGDGME
ncbi:MAG TPA: cupin domain-containing protein [Opitutaceae bacterium]|nr:cupin domain-containing protein [Opitutaceae bacterium]